MLGKIINDIIRDIKWTAEKLLQTNSTNSGQTIDRLKIFLICSWLKFLQTIQCDYQTEILFRFTKVKDTHILLKRIKTVSQIPSLLRV